MYSQGWALTKLVELQNLGWFILEFMRWGLWVTHIWLILHLNNMGVSWPWGSIAMASIFPRESLDIAMINKCVWVGVATFLVLGRFAYNFVFRLLITMTNYLTEAAYMRKDLFHPKFQKCQSCKKWTLQPIFSWRCSQSLPGVTDTQEVLGPLPLADRRNLPVSELWEVESSQKRDQSQAQNSH